MTINRISHSIGIITVLSAWMLVVTAVLIRPFFILHTQGDSVIVLFLRDLMLLWIAGPKCGLLFGVSGWVWITAGLLYLVAWRCVRFISAGSQNPDQEKDFKTRRRFNSISKFIGRNVILAYAIIAILTPLCIHVLGPACFQTLQMLRDSNGSWIIQVKLVISTAGVLILHIAAALLFIPLPILSFILKSKKIKRINQPGLWR